MTSTIAKITNPQEGIDSLQEWREVVFLKTIRIVGIIGAFSYIIGIALDYENIFADLRFFFLYSLVYIFVMTAAFIPRLSTVSRIYIFTSAIAILGIVTSIEKAAIGDGRMWLLLAVFLAAVLLGRRAGLVYVILAALVWALIGVFYISSVQQQPSVDQFSFGI